MSTEQLKELMRLSKVNITPPASITGFQVDESKTLTLVSEKKKYHISGLATVNINII